ncbi:MAG: hypothetical protein CYG59_04420 [Chloroflexi bacterium]|nr:MAG: hypothetical protein CYG59_04420 [Chloroflexota bacterium]
MSQRLWVRIGALSGVVYVVLLIAGFAIGVASAPTPPSIFGTPEQVANQTAAVTPMGVWIGLYLEVVALLCFVVFAAFVRTLTQSVEHEAQWLDDAAFGAALIFASLQLLSMAILGLVSYRAGTGANVATATALLDLRLGGYILSWSVGALWLGLVAATALRTGMLGRGLGVSGLLIALVWLASCIIPTSDVAQFWGFVPLVWTTAASINMLRRSTYRREITNSGVLSSGTLS